MIKISQESYGKMRWFAYRTDGLPRLYIAQNGSWEEAAGDAERFYFSSKEDLEKAMEKNNRTLALTTFKVHYDVLSKKWYADCGDSRFFCVDGTICDYDEASKDKFYFSSEEVLFNVITRYIEDRGFLVVQDRVRLAKSISAVCVMRRSDHKHLKTDGQWEMSYGLDVDKFYFDSRERAIYTLVNTLKTEAPPKSQTESPQSGPQPEMPMNDYIEVPVPHKVLRETICYALDVWFQNALGADYGAYVKERKLPPNTTWNDFRREGKFWYSVSTTNIFCLDALLPMFGGTLVMGDGKIIDQSILTRALMIMMEKYPTEFTSLEEETNSFRPASILMQCVLFGEVKYNPEED